MFVNSSSMVNPNAVTPKATTPSVNNIAFKAAPIKVNHLVKEGKNKTSFFQELIADSGFANAMSYLTIALGLLAGGYVVPWLESLFAKPPEVSIEMPDKYQQYIDENGNFNAVEYEKAVRTMYESF